MRRTGNLEPIFNSVFKIVNQKDLHLITSKQIFGKKQMNLRKPSFEIPLVLQPKDHTDNRNMIGLGAEIWGILHTHSIVFEIVSTATF